MAYQAPAFYFYHGLREGSSLSASVPFTPDSMAPLLDSRQGELFTFDAVLGGGPKQIAFIRPGDAASDAIDTIIISGQNWTGNEFDVTTTAETLISPDYVVTEAAGELVIVPFDSTDPQGAPDTMSLRIFQGGGAAILAEMTEVMFTTKRTMSRGPEPNWEHPWERTQRRFLSDGGVSSTWMTGAARKRFRLTWRYLFGADRQIFLDMREQTDQWSQPFFFQPPDDIYPTLLVELDRDSDWRQDFEAPLDSGTSDAITLPLIEVLG